MTPVYIPVSSISLTLFIKSSAANSVALRQIQTDELIGLFALQYVPSLLSESNSSMLFERILGQLFASLRQMQDNGMASELRKELFRGLDRGKVAAGAKEMFQLHIRLLDAETIKMRSYLTYEGEWDYTFGQSFSGLRYRDDYLIKPYHGTYLLTDDQIRALSVVAGESDEHLHLQGYAGSGKTFLIQSIIDVYKSRGVDPSNILLLAGSTAQLNALKKTIKDKIATLTLGSLAGSILPNEYYGLKRPWSRNDFYGVKELCDDYAIVDLPDLTKTNIAGQVFGIIRTFCESAELEITTDLLPWWFKEKGRFKGETLALGSAKIISTAKDLWQKILMPPTGFSIPIFDYYKIKAAALLNLTIPASWSYKHIIIDESHDLSPAMLQIIEGIPQSCISLGDCYQNLKGQESEFRTNIHTRAITHSFRSGTDIEQILNPLIISHPFKMKDHFQGNDEIYMNVEYYHKPEVPDRPSCILVSDEWAQWEWIHRLAKKKLYFGTFAPTQNIDRFVSDVFVLKNLKTRPKHFGLAKFRTWDDLCSAFWGNPSFKAIFQLIDSGKYQYKDWQKDLAFWKSEGKSLYYVDRARNARNQEMDRVLVTPDNVAALDTGFSKEYAVAASELYVAITRAKQVLMAPISLREWIEDATARQSKVIERYRF